MPAPSWPTGLPLAQLTPNQNISPRNLRTEMENGWVRNRRQFDNPLEAYDVGWTFTQDEFETFKDFFDGTLVNGTEVFNIEFLGQERTVAFLDCTYSFSRSDNEFQVRATIEIASAPTVLLTIDCEHEDEGEEVHLMFVEEQSFFRVVVSNSQQEVTEGLQIVVTVPSNFTIGTVDPPADTQVGNVLTFNFDTFASEGSLIIDVFVTPDETEGPFAFELEIITDNPTDPLSILTHSCEVTVFDRRACRIPGYGGVTEGGDLFDCYQAQSFTDDGEVTPYAGLGWGTTDLWMVGAGPFNIVNAEEDFESYSAGVITSGTLNGGIGTGTLGVPYYSGFDDEWMVGDGPPPPP